MTDSSVALRRAPGLAALIPDPSRRILRLAFPIALHQSACRHADRTPYTRVIVNRLALKDKVIKASEHFEDG